MHHNGTKFFPFLPTIAKQLLTKKEEILKGNSGVTVDGFTFRVIEKVNDHVFGKLFDKTKNTCIKGYLTLN